MLCGLKSLSKFASTYDNYCKQILVVAFYFFPTESSESPCLKIVLQHI